ncbi:DUF2911 domain-containing protein [Dyadobacter aurulentus]|uniref:DUF2911 domain-containing protein n=1 Tax=Dyadobacter sp. UC 10 TaxID=2605428 RepID=UPI0011F25928|nr:DUF2911 domain-containing protein [Dyadobacter sp. UC 10]KAA0992407.1 DUF2911 domain-containing protein [Dyadobacter sp. UC 10]
MKTTTLLKGFALLLAGTLTANVSQAQDKPKPSPAETATGKAGGATITISYSAPSVKGRKIFGELVPYDKVWRAGANEATIFQTDKDIMVEGQALKAGKYSLYAIPGANEWSFIFNSETGQWGIKRGGDTSKDPAKDVLTVKAKPMKSGSMAEKLAYEVTANGFVLRWDNTEVPVAIK